jgi:hypothetical protein
MTESSSQSDEESPQKDGFFPQSDAALAWLSQ